VIRVRLLAMWNCSTPPSLLLPFGDDYRESLGSSYTVQCEGSSSRAGAVGLESGQHVSFLFIRVVCVFFFLESPHLFAELNFILS
jgi:hypothetical protein